MCGVILRHRCVRTSWFAVEPNAEFTSINKVNLDTVRSTGNYISIIIVKKEINTYFLSVRKRIDDWGYTMRRNWLYTLWLDSLALSIRNFTFKYHFFRLPQEKSLHQHILSGNDKKPKETIGWIELTLNVKETNWKRLLAEDQNAMAAQVPGNLWEAMDWFHQLCRLPLVQDLQDLRLCRRHNVCTFRKIYLCTIYDSNFSG